MYKVNVDGLISKAQNGDKKALEEIIKMYKPFIIKSARQIYINGYEVDDLVQIGAIALMKAVNKYDLERKVIFTAYAIAAVKNAFNGEIRKVITKKWDEKFKCSLNSLNKDGIEFIEMLASEDDVEEDIVLKEQINILRKALEKLSEDEREIIEWFYIKNKPLKEYAGIKNITPNLAVKRKGRAMEKLKIYFFKEY